MTLAELKRKLTVGTRLRVTHSLLGPVNPPRGAGRTVVKVQSNAVVFECDERSDDRQSWLYWPKAKDLHATSDGFEIIENGEVAVRYRWLD